MGENKYGQLGVGKKKSSKAFQVIESLLDENIAKIFAGSRSAFATTRVQNSMHQFIREYEEENKLDGMIVDSGDDDELKQKGMMKVKTNDGCILNVHGSLWSIYFNQDPQ